MGLRAGGGTRHAGGAALKAGQPRSAATTLAERANRTASLTVSSGGRAPTDAAAAAVVAAEWDIDAAASDADKLAA